MQDIFIGLAILAVLGIIAYLATHHKAPQTASGKDLANAISADSLDIWGALRRDLPAIINAELAQKNADLASALQDLQGLRDKLAATIAAHTADKAAVAARVAAAVTASPELPPSPVVPAVAAAQAADVADVRALATEFSPASQTLT